MRASLSFIITIAMFLLFVPPLTIGDDGMKVDVLFDFGDGKYLWSDSVLGSNRTAFNATLSAADKLGINITYTWFELGVFITDIGDRFAEYPMWWHLFAWNKTINSWEFSSLGASDLMMEDGDVIAWLLAVDNPDTFESPLPSPTPLHRYPVLQFRGDNSNTGNHLGQFCGDFNKAWQYDTKAFEISGTPAAFQGIIFVPTWTGLFALSTDDGALIWKRDDIRGMSSPAIYNAGLFIGGNDGLLHYIAASNGTEIWNVSLISQPDFTGIASSPKVYGDKVFIGLFNERGGSGGVVAINVWNRSIMWKHDSPSVHMSSPAIRGDTLYIGIMGYYNTSSITFDPPYGLLALNVSDGIRQWFLSTSGPVASSPLVLHDSIVFTSRDGILHIISLNGSSFSWSTLSPSTSSPATDGQSIFVADGIMGRSGSVTAFSQRDEQLWKTSLPGPVQSSPLYVDGLVFVSTNDANGSVYGLNATGGNIEWWFTPTPQEYMLSSPIVADGKLFIASDNGMVYAFGCVAESPSGFDYLLVLVVPLIIIIIFLVIIYYSRRRVT